ncbi:MAG TPA: helix-turn-helix domain-containing protein, partial [Longimicrobium sp.]|nr:helix-turn-helix domain-containing protein [Longimicrobium sp.]
MISEELPLTPEEIARLIKASGRNQKSFAAELGIRPATVSNWVNGVGSPSHENAAKLRALKPLPRAVPEWTAYMADVKARIARNRNPPELPLVAVDPEPIAESVAAKVATPSQLADAVKAVIPTAPEVADAVRAVIPTASQTADAVKAVIPTATEVADLVKSVIPTAPEVADAVRAAIPTATDIATQLKATVPTAQDVAAEVNATIPIASLAKTMKRGVALIVAVVVLGVSAMAALAYRAASSGHALASARLPPVSDAATGAHGAPGIEAYLRAVLGTLLDLGKKVEENWIPKSPYPGQKLEKDCDRSLGETPINGGCWVPVAPSLMAPPCGKLFR